MNLHHTLITHLNLLCFLCEGQTTHTDESLSRTYTQIKGQSVNILIVASFSTVVVVYQSLLEVRPHCKAYTKLLRGLVCPKAIPLTFLLLVLSCWHLVVITLTHTKTSKAWSNCFWEIQIVAVKIIKHAQITRSHAAITFWSDLFPGASYHQCKKHNCHLLTLNILNLHKLLKCLDLFA